MEVVVCESHIMWESPRMGVAVCGSRGVRESWELRCLEVAGVSKVGIVTHNCE